MSGKDKIDMRIVQFRGKTIRNNIWKYGNLCIDPGGMFISESGCYGWAEVYAETVGQFTGLTDKNGKEIYEGDIMSNGTSDYTMEYRNGAFRLIRHNISCYVISDVDISEFEIIGNIHDSSHTNPER